MLVTAKGFETIKLVPIQKETQSFVEKWAGAFKLDYDIDIKKARDEKLKKYESID